MVTADVIAVLEAQDQAIVQQADVDWKPDIDAADAEVTAIQAAYEAGDIDAAQWLAGLKVAR